MSSLSMAAGGGLDGRCWPRCAAAVLSGGCSSEAAAFTGAAFWSSAASCSPGSCLAVGSALPTAFSGSCAVLSAGSCEAVGGRREAAPPVSAPRASLP